MSPFPLEETSIKDGTVRNCQNEGCDYKITVENAELKIGNKAEDAISARG